jgi:hypothetical protein
VLKVEAIGVRTGEYKYPAPPNIKKGRKHQLSADIYGLLQPSFYINRKLLANRS